jgi:hypothetical protein
LGLFQKEMQMRFYKIDRHQQKNNGADDIGNKSIIVKELAIYHRPHHRE